MSPHTTLNRTHETALKGWRQVLQCHTSGLTFAQVTEALGHWLAAAKVIHVTVPGEAPGNPWLDAFGRSATDTDFPEFLEELQRLRTTDPPA